MHGDLTRVLQMLIALAVVMEGSSFIVIAGVGSAPIISQDGFGFSLQRRHRVSPTEVTLKGYDTWLSSGTMPIGMFGGVFDGRMLWLTPCNGDRVVRLDPSNGSMSGNIPWPSDFTKAVQAFESSIYDGTFVWLIPYSADRLIRLNPLTGNMTSYWLSPSASLPGYVKGPKAFQGATFDGSFIWLIPCDADRIVRFNVSDGSLAGYSTWPSGFSGLVAGAYSGGVYDGRSQVWLVPHNADSLIAISVQTGNITGPYPWPSAFNKGLKAFVGGVFDGFSVWLVPHDAALVVKVRPSDGNTTIAGTGWPGAPFAKVPAAFAGAVFDGTSIWLVPHLSRCMIRINVSTEVMTPYCTWALPGFSLGTHAFVGGVFDGQSLWLVPFEANMVVGVHFTAADNTSTPTPTLTLPTTSISLSEPTSTLTDSKLSVSATWSGSRSRTWREKSRVVGRGRPKRVSRTTPTLSFSNTLSSMRTVLIFNESKTTTKSQYRVPIPTPRPRVNAMVKVLPSETAAKVVAVGSVATALAVSAFTPTMSVQAGRPFALLRIVDCKLASVLDLQGDDPDYLEFPIQTQLGSGAFPNYVGSMALSVGVLVGIPTVAIGSLYMILQRTGATSKPLHFLQRKIASNAFFTSVGYFLPSVWKVMVLVSGGADTTGSQNAASIALVSLYTLADVIIFSVLLYTAVCLVPRRTKYGNFACSISCYRWRGH